MQYFLQLDTTTYSGLRSNSVLILPVKGAEPAFAGPAGCSGSATYTVQVTGHALYHKLRPGYIAIN